MISTSKEFANAYEHPAFNGIEIKFWRNKREFYLFYNNQRYDGIPKLNYLENKEYIDNQNESIKDTKVIYNIIMDMYKLHLLYLYKINYVQWI